MEEPSFTQRRPGWEIAVALLALAIASAVWTVGYNESYFVFPDAVDYAQMGAELREGHGFATRQIFPMEAPWLKARGYLNGAYWPNLHRFPLPTLAHAGAQMFFRSPIDAAIFQSGLWYLLSLPLVFLLARRCMGLAGALLCMLFVAGDPHLFENSYMGMGEPLATLILLCAVYVAVCWPARAATWATLGVICGLAYLARTNFVYLTPFAMAWAFGQGRWRAAGLALAGSLVAVSPWLLRNILVAGSPGFSFMSAYTLAWGAVPGTLLYHLHDAPSTPGGMMALYGSAIRAKAMANFLPNILSMSFWGDMFQAKSWMYPLERSQGVFAIPFLFLCLVSLFHSAARPCRALPWAVLLLVGGNFLLMCMANHEARYYAPFRPLVIIAGMAALLALIGLVNKTPYRRALAVGTLVALAGVAITQYYSVAAAHQAVRDAETQPFPPLSPEDLQAYARLREITEPGTIFASDVSDEVALFTERRAIRLPEIPTELLELDQDFLPIDYVLAGRRTLSWRRVQYGYKPYAEFFESPEFLARFERVEELPNGTILFRRI